MLKFYRVDYATEERKEITHEKALNIVLGTFRDCDMTRDMLTLPNRIKCRYSQIDVESVDEAGRVMVAIPGCYNLVPIDAQYDEITGERFHGMTDADVMELVKSKGYEQAYNYMLLCGPDSYEGADYFGTLEKLEKMLNK